MGIIQGVKSQAGGIAKGAVKQILQEPVEILKTTAEQVAKTETPEDQQTQTPSPQQAKLNSLEEQKKPRILAAHRRELKEIMSVLRKERAQKQKEQEKTKEQETQEKKQLKETKKESIFQKGLSLVERLKRRVETRFPKAA